MDRIRAGNGNLQFCTVGSGPDERRIAVLADAGQGAADQPPIVWLGGFRSDMRATKAEALARWARENGRDFVRFDYGGHGESGGRFEDGTISRWLEDAMAVLAEFAPACPILVGSSMGGWIALLAARASLAQPGRTPSALLLIAPAVDFTESLMWEAFPQSIRDQIMTTGQWLRESAYSPEPYPITRGLIEDGRRNLLLGSPIRTGCPVHVLQGMADPDVPWQHALRLMEHLASDPAVLTLVKDGDHRLSRDQDIALLLRLVAAL
jgi:pimeloyl-ACP methyl ester carboxylesterase